MKRLGWLSSLSSGLLCLIVALLVLSRIKCQANEGIGIASTAGEKATVNATDAQTFTNNHLCYKLQDEEGKAVYPASVLRIGNDLYFLGIQSVWLCLGAKTVPGSQDILVLKKIDPPAPGKLGIPCQEFNDFIYVPERKSFSILDKSGDLFEFKPLEKANKQWRILKLNTSALGAPDPDYIALCEMNNDIALLDPERNQVWLLADDKTAKLQGLLPGVLAWKLKPGDINITDGIGIAYKNGQIYILRKNGLVNKYDTARSKTAPGKYSYTGQLSFQRPTNFRPSRIYFGENGDVYFVERENNRVIKASAKQNAAQAFIFPPGSNLRGMIVSGESFWIINGNYFFHKGIGDEKPLTAKCYPRVIDKRLAGLILPIDGQHLPGHPGVYPGARRLYRFGVHAGLDLFNQPGSKVKVGIGTPVKAACAGKIIRIDSNFKDMNYAIYNKTVKECMQTHHTSAENEDRFRGRQIWIDSENGLVTKYAHLNGVNNKLHVGDWVKQGQIIGYVGISGTGENLPGRVPAPHLHFEVWIDKMYLGWSRTPAETMSLFEDIFARK